MTIPDKTLDLNFDNDLKRDADEFGLGAGALLNNLDEAIAAVEPIEPINPSRNMAYRPAKPLAETEATLALRDEDIIMMIKVLLEVFDGTHAYVQDIRQYFETLGEALEDGSFRKLKQIQGLFCLNGQDVQTMINYLLASFTPRVRTAQHADQTSTKIYRLQRQTAAIHCASMALKVISAHEQWPGAPRKWTTWFNRFSKSYEIAKGNI